MRYEPPVAIAHCTPPAGGVTGRIQRNRRFRGTRLSSHARKSSVLYLCTAVGGKGDCTHAGRQLFRPQGRRMNGAPRMGKWHPADQREEAKPPAAQRYTPPSFVFRLSSPPQRRSPYPSRSTARSSFFGRPLSASRRIREIASFAKRLVFTVSQSVSVTISALPPSKSNCSSPQSPSKSTR